MNLLDLAKEATAAYYAANDGNATPEQAAELHALVPYVCRLVGEAEVVGALAIALADPTDALTCYRALAAELVPPAVLPEAHDDRRRCTACANLTPTGVCRAALRGARIGKAGCEYHPAYPEQPRRCEGYAPGPANGDRRPAADRWPGLAEGTRW